MTDSTSGTSFGRSVALSGDGTIVGITTAGSTNKVYVYQYSSGSWSLVGSVISTTVWGENITMSNDGTKVAVGHIASGTGGVVNAFEYDSGTNSWSQMGSTITAENSGDRNGQSLSFDKTGTILAIGAVRASDVAANMGHTRMFQYSGGSWSQIGSDIDGEAAHDQSGISVSLNYAGDIVVIGAAFNDGNGNDSGHVRVYQYSGGSWSQIGSDINGPSSNIRFGEAVSINGTGDLIVVGAITDGSGKVYAYYYSSGSWTQVGSSMSITGPYAGYRLALSKNNSIVAFSSETSGLSGATGIYKIASTVTTSEIYNTSRGLVGIGVESPSYELDVSGNTNTTSLIVSSSAIMPISTPSSASDTGTTGQVAVDTNYVYVCTATNTWKRAALSSW
jgi:hypothetical protein